MCNYKEFIKGINFLAKLGKCLGCRAGDGWSECPVRICALEKNVDYCFNCSEYPCELINKFRWMRKYSDDLKAKGYKEYIKEKLSKI